MKERSSFASYLSLNEVKGWLIKMKYGLVLAGGGVRGAFHIGVWKALRELNIELSAAVGTSIGAINSALVAQGEYETAARLWRQISIDDIVKLPSEMDGENNIFKLKNIAGLARSIRDNDGLDMAPLEEILRAVIDEDRLRKSPVDFGAAAFSLTEKKGIYKFKKEIPAGQLISFIMASASILSTKTVEHEKFSDGGIYDNMPVSMLTGKGVKDIITVDVQGVGLNRSFNSAGKNIISIRSQNPQTGIMDFDRGGIMRSVDEGYLACMKAFGRAAGDSYYFDSGDYGRARAKYSPELISGIEAAAKIFDISNLEIYTFDGLCALVLDAYYKQSQKGTPDMSPEKLKKQGDNMLLIWLIKAIENGKFDFAADKLSFLGNVYDAASAIMYFKNA